MPETVKEFEDLRVYQTARKLVRQVYDLTRRSPFSHDRSLADQIRRAAVSIVSNIAEGYERGSAVELIQFLYIAKGSCGEVRAQIGIAADVGHISEAEKTHVVEECKKIGRMLATFIDYLKKGKFPGQKFRKPPWRPFAEEVKEVVEKIQRDLETRKHSPNRPPP